MLELCPPFLEMAEFVGLVRFVSAILTLALLPDALFLAACVGRNDLDRLQPQGSSSNQESRASLLNTQKNRKIKKP